jgi:hypothetical protein
MENLELRLVPYFLFNEQIEHFIEIKVVVPSQVAGRVGIVAIDIFDIGRSAQFFSDNNATDVQAQFFEYIMDDIF